MADPIASRTRSGRVPNVVDLTMNGNQSEISDDDLSVHAIDQRSSSSNIHRDLFLQDLGRTRHPNAYLSRVGLGGGSGNDGINIHGDGSDNNDGGSRTNDHGTGNIDDDGEEDDSDNGDEEDNSDDDDDAIHFPRDSVGIHANRLRERRARQSSEASDGTGSLGQGGGTVSVARLYSPLRRSGFHSDSDSSDESNIIEVYRRRRIANPANMGRNINRNYRNTTVTSFRMLAMQRRRTAAASAAAVAVSNVRDSVSSADTYATAISEAARASSASPDNTDVRDEDEGGGGTSATPSALEARTLPDNSGFIEAPQTSTKLRKLRFKIGDGVEVKVVYYTPPHTKLMKLCFKVGDRVEVKECSGWVSGTVQELWHWSKVLGWLPYRVLLDSSDSCGRLLISLAKDKVRPSSTSLRFRVGDRVEVKHQYRPNDWTEGVVTRLWDHQNGVLHQYLICAQHDGRTLWVTLRQDSPQVLRAYRPKTPLSNLTLRYKTNNVVEFNLWSTAGIDQEGGKWVKALITKEWVHLPTVRQGRVLTGSWAPYQLTILDSGEEKYASADKQSVVRSLPMSGMAAFDQRTRDLNTFVASSNWSLEQLRIITSTYRSMVTNIEDKEAVEMKNIVQKEEEMRCVICCVEPKSVVLLPCRHQCVCTTCSSRCIDCPLCRCSISDTITVFM